MAIYKRVKAECPHCNDMFWADVYDDTDVVTCKKCKGSFAKSKKWKGEWGISYTVNGRKVRETIRDGTRELAEIALGKRRREIAENAYLDKPRQCNKTFSDFAEEFCSFQVGRKKVGTIRYYKVKISNLKKTFAHVKIEKITPLDIERYINLRLDKDKMSRASVNREICVLKAMYRKANEWGYTFNNPVSKIKAMREHNERTRVLSMEEITSLLEAVSPRHKPIIVLALNTGMRKAEILGLRWSDVDLVERVIRLANTEEIKNSEPRVIPLNHLAVDALKTIPKALSREDFVFRGAKGGRVENMQWWFDPACKKAGIANLVFHDLRRTFITMSVEAGVDVATVCKIAGIKTVQVMVRKYLRTRQKHDSDSMSRLASLYDGTILEPQRRKEVGKNG